jgi:hypothetical protein
MNLDMIATVIAVTVSSLTFAGAMAIVRRSVTETSRSLKKIEKDIEGSELYNHPLQSGNGHAAHH